MAAMYERLRQVVGKKDKITPPEEYYNTGIQIEPATGTEKELLEAETRQLLNKQEFTDHDFFQFTGNMVKLIGGSKLKSNTERVYSESDNSDTIVDESKQLAISFSRWSGNWKDTGSHHEEGSVSFQPDWWATVNDNIELWENRKEPVILEQLNLNSSPMHTDRPGQAVPKIEYNIFFPPKYEAPRFQSHALAQDVNLLDVSSIDITHNQYDLGEYEDERQVSVYANWETVPNVCKAAFAVYESTR